MNGDLWPPQHTPLATWQAPRLLSFLWWGKESTGKAVTEWEKQIFPPHLSTRSNRQKGHIVPVHDSLGARRMEQWRFFTPRVSCCSCWGVKVVCMLWTFCRCQTNSLCLFSVTEINRLLQLWCPFGRSFHLLWSHSASLRQETCAGRLTSQLWSQMI